MTKDTDRWRIHRYMVFGKDPKTFTRALNFNVPSTPETPAAPPGNSSGTKLNSYPAPAQPVYPAANTVVKKQTPDISISLTGEPSLDPRQMEMRVSGFGLDVYKRQEWRGGRGPHSGSSFLRAVRMYW